MPKIKTIVCCGSDLCPAVIGAKSGRPGQSSCTCVSGGSYCGDCHKRGCPAHHPYRHKFVTTEAPPKQEKPKAKAKPKKKPAKM